MTAVPLPPLIINAQGRGTAVSPYRASQDDGRQTRFLLTDGLGSVRTEMVGGVVETTTTYEPYGNLLTQTGTSGTTYGFTGEQEDAATGLVYLRARYYNPSLKTFISRDPFPGWIRTPASQHGYSYVHNNSVNNVDPTGEMCLLGFSVGPGRGCTDAQRAQAAQFVNFIGGFVSSPAFATGFVYELVDSVAVSGVSIGSGLLEVILKDTQIGRTAAAQLSLDLTAYYNGQKYSVPYFQSPSGKVFDLWVKPGWS